MRVVKGGKVLQCKWVGSVVVKDSFACDISVVSWHINCADMLFLKQSRDSLYQRIKTE